MTEPFADDRRMQEFEEREATQEELQEFYTLRVPLENRELVIQRYEHPSGYPAISPSDLPNNICMRCGWEAEDRDLVSPFMEIVVSDQPVDERRGSRFPPGRYRICAHCLLEVLGLCSMFGQMQTPTPRIEVQFRGGRR
jgi:hypothetical protein